MTEIRFYHVQNQMQEKILAMLVSTALGRGHRIVVKCADERQVQQINEYLWTFSSDSFLPHGSAKEGFTAQQPIWLTAQDENPNNADVVFILSGAQSSMQENFMLCCELLNGNDPDDVAQARMRWKNYKERNFNVTYWQQNERGGWEKKA